MNSALINWEGRAIEAHNRMIKLEAANAELIEKIESLNDWWIAARVENGLHEHWKSYHNFDYPQLVIDRAMSYTQESAALSRMQNGEKEIIRLRKVNSQLRAKIQQKKTNKKG